jgi:hypothetical protein
MGQITRKDFSAGYIPSDDWYNGRDNGLMRMDNVFEDEFGNLSLVRGSIQINLNPFATPVSYLYSKVMNSTKYRYVALTGGACYRDTSSGNFTAPFTIFVGGLGFGPRTTFGCAYGFVLATNLRNRFKDDTSGVLRNLGIKAPSTKPTAATGGGTGLTGNYVYIQVNAAEFPQYIAQSPGGPQSLTVSPANQDVILTPFVTGIDAQVTHHYWFRFGGTLDQFYFVGKSLVGTTFDDTSSDQTVLLIDIPLNQFLASIGDLQDEIIGMTGPFYGRMLYLTFKQIIISEQYNIDAYDTRKVITLSAAAGVTNKNLFITAFPLAAILVGTTDDIYEITGTLADLSDGTMDILVRQYGLLQPPINESFALYNNRLFYVAMDGVRELTGITSMLISQNLQLLWRNSDADTGF